jgi:multiple sugar transport system ATP-binding protein
VIITTNVSKQYGRRTVLRSIEFQLPERHWCSIVGASGSGKSTLLRIISGLLDPDSGHISVCALSDPPKRREIIAYMMQDFPLYPSLSVAGNLHFAVSRQYSSDGPSLDQIIRQLRIEHVLEQLPAKLSGGERQRVALARTLLLHRPVLFLDEPLSNIDVVLRRLIRRYLKSLHKEWGYTTVLVTHDQEDAISTSDLVAVLSEGVLLQWGKPADVFAHPASDIVANAFGDVQMCWLPLSMLPASLRANIIIPSGCSIVGVRETAFKWSTVPRPDFWESEVYEWEYLGSRVRLLARMNDYHVSVVLSNGPTAMPQKLWIQPDLTSASYYDSTPISRQHN